MMIFCTLLPLGDAFTRIVREHDIHVTQVLCLEYGIVTAILLFMIKKPSFKEIVAAPLKKWHAARAVAFFLAAVVWIGVIKFVPLSQLFTIGFLAPIFASLMSVFLLGERLTKPKVIGLIVGLLGAVVMIRPGFQQVSPALWLALLSPLFWSCTTVSTKKLSATYSQTTLLFVMAITTFGLSLPLAYHYWAPVPSHLWIFIGLIPMIGLMVHGALIVAYKHAPLSVLAPLEFSTLIFATLYAFIIFGETIDTYTCLGAIIIVASTLYVTLKTNQGSKPVSIPLDG